MMDGWPSQPPGVGQNLAQLWGGQGFGGLGSAGAVPPNVQSLPQSLLQSPNTPNVGQIMARQTTPLSPSQAASAGGFGSSGPGFTQGDLWQRLMNAVGNPGAGGTKMPGTTVGAPAGQAPAMAPPAMPMLSQTQMAAPPGAAAYFRNLQALQQPATGGGNPGLMQQYMALQQLMRGA